MGQYTDWTSICARSEKIFYQFKILTFQPTPEQLQTVLEGEKTFELKISFLLIWNLKTSKEFHRFLSETILFSEEKLSFWGTLGPQTWHVLLWLIINLLFQFETDYWNYSNQRREFSAFYLMLLNLVRQDLARLMPDSTRSPSLGSGGDSVCRMDLTAKITRYNTLITRSLFNVRISWRKKIFDRKHDHLCPILWYFTFYSG